MANLKLVTIPIGVVRQVHWQDDCRIQKNHSRWRKYRGTPIYLKHWDFCMMARDLCKLKSCEERHASLVFMLLALSILNTAAYHQHCPPCFPSSTC
jgi:hypothetical protein